MSTATLKRELASMRSALQSLTPVAPQSLGDPVGWAEGIAELTEKIEGCRQFFETSALRAEKKREAARQRLMTQLQERLVSTALQQVFSNGDLDRIAGEIAERKQDPYSIVDRIVRSTKFERP